MVAFVIAVPTLTHRQKIQSVVTGQAPATLQLSGVEEYTREKITQHTLHTITTVCVQPWYLSQIPSNLSTNLNGTAVLNGLNTVLVPHCTETFISL